MKYHVITPFRRFENLQRMLAMLEPFNLEWNILLDKNLPFKVSVPGDWVKCFYLEPAQPFWRAWANHINKYIELAVIVPEDRYLILNDDDFYEPDFFSKIDKHSGEVIICSMLRGHRTPPGLEPIRCHGTHTLTACPQNMQVGAVGCEQMIVSGRIFSGIKLTDEPCADGVAICNVVKSNPVDYAPEAFVWFNYLEPGRWNHPPQ